MNRNLIQKVRKMSRAEVKVLMGDEKIFLALGDDDEVEALRVMRDQGPSAGAVYLMVLAASYDFDAAGMFSIAGTWYGEAATVVEESHPCVAQALLCGRRLIEEGACWAMHSTPKVELSVVGWSAQEAIFAPQVLIKMGFRALDTHGVTTPEWVAAHYAEMAFNEVVEACDAERAKV